MAKNKVETVRELLFWSYANLAMAHTAVEKGLDSYGRFNYMIRARLGKGLLEGSMNVRTIFDDEKIKLELGKTCSYCGASENLALDHIIPRKAGGRDLGDNLVYACRKCNSSKGKKDLMVWMTANDSFPPLMILRRYLKLVIAYCLDHDLMEMQIEEVDQASLPFSLSHIPLKYPKPCDLRLVAEDD